MKQFFIISFLIVIVVVGIFLWSEKNLVRQEMKWVTITCYQCKGEKEIVIKVIWICDICGHEDMIYLDEDPNSFLVAHHPLSEILLKDGQKEKRTCPRCRRVTPGHIRIEKKRCPLCNGTGKIKEFRPVYK